MSVTANSIANNEQHEMNDVGEAKAQEFRELCNEGWIEVDAHNISKMKFETILEMLNNGHGVTRRQIRIKFNKDMLMMSIQHAEAQVRTEAIAYIYRKWYKERTQRKMMLCRLLVGWMIFNLVNNTVWRIANGVGPHYEFVSVQHGRRMN
ncbi:hypothetical protein K492DRAFT_195711 [Lichtheimia hyalospora FSU 10163]|nr:hypothetical protein K492DRAFT_195711 [Lichtheimia hyalospora FSU 10163]